MESVPEQHIQSLPVATQQDVYKKIELLCKLRALSSDPEDELASKVGVGSAAAMHHQLRIWGLAGLLPVERIEQAPKVIASKDGGERKARRGGGDAEELPPAAEAIELFQATIGRLKSDLAYITHLEEVLQDGRFAKTLYYPKEAEMHPEMYVRETVSPERWEELCAEQGEDPTATDTLYIHRDRRLVAEASPFPAKPLVRLIAAYLVCARSWHEVELLLERLHPRDRKPDVEKIKRYLTGETSWRDRDDALLPITRRLAKLVRGGEVKRGLDPSRLDSVDHTVARHIRDRSEQGVPEEDIRRVLREEHNVPKEEISRLSKIFAPRRSG